MGLPEISTTALIKHRVAMQLEEQGVKAAAETNNDWFWANAPSKYFVVDRPFLFFIRNTVTGNTIMCGCINNID